MLRQFLDSGTLVDRQRLAESPKAHLAPAGIVQRPRANLYLRPEAMMKT